MNKHTYLYFLPCPKTEILTLLKTKKNSAIVTKSFKHDKIIKLGLCSSVEQAL